MRLSLPCLRGLIQQRLHLKLIYVKIGCLARHLMVNSERKEVSFESDSLEFYFKVNIQTPTEFDTSLFEIFTIINYRLGGLSKTIDFRGNAFETAEDSLVFNNVQYIDSQQFIDSTYYDLIVSNNNIMWYNKTHGLVAFRYKDQLYELKTIE
jgi:hypothetical protein